MTDKQLLEQALEALEADSISVEKYEATITAIRARLEQPEQEPTFWYYTLVVEGQVVNEAFTTVNWDTRFEPFGRHGIDHGGEVTKEPLYTTPPAAPVQEPSIPEGWERRTVVGFDALVEALDYAERKGFMPDYIASAWEGFNYMADESSQS